MKKIISTALALVILLTFAACGDSKPKDNGDKDDKNTTSTVNLAEGFEFPELESAEVSWLLSTTLDTFEANNTEESPNAMYQTLKLWEKHYGTAVNLEVVSWDSFTTYLSTSAASGSTPDVVYGGTTWFPLWPSKGLVQPLDEYLDLTNEKWNSDIMQQLTWKGKHYVAYGQTPEYFYICYNKSKFELAGEKTPLEHWQDGTWTWTQFKQTALNMTDTSANEYGYAGWNFGVNKSIYPLVSLGNDGSLVSQATNSKVKRWFTELNDFIKSGAKRTDNSDSSFLNTFPAGKDAMIHISPEEYIRMQIMLEVTGGDEFGIAPNFVFDPNGETEPRMTSNIYGYSISAQAKNPKAAAAIIDLYYTVYNNIEKNSGELGLFGKYLNEDEFKAITEANKATHQINFIAGLGNAVSLFGESVGKVVYSPTKEGSVSALLDSYDSVLKAELQEFAGSIG
ncbi:MAG: extracellular solute-binding protein [Clostridia bacterium]|nr:extracellular solute-binding protein [Clostridia bacterium]